MTEQKLYTIPEAMELLNLGQTKVYQLINAGDLKALKLGRRTLISRVSLDEFIGGLPSFKSERS